MVSPVFDPHKYFPPRRGPYSRQKTTRIELMMTELLLLSSLLSPPASFPCAVFLSPLCLPFPHLGQRSVPMPT